MWPEEPPSPAPITCAPRRHQPHSKPLETTNPFYLICCFGKIYINGVNNMWPLSVLFYLVSWSPDSPVTAWLSTSLLFQHDSALHSFFHNDPALHSFFGMTRHFTPFSAWLSTSLLFHSWVILPLVFYPSVSAYLTLSMVCWVLMTKILWGLCFHLSCICSLHLTFL